MLRRGRQSARLGCANPEPHATVRCACLALLFLLAATAWSQEYFPRDIQLPRPIRDYSDALRELREPSLLELSRSDQRAHVYRFLSIRTFFQPILLRFSIGDDGRAQLIHKSTRIGGLSPHDLQTFPDVYLSTVKARSLANAFTRCKFWSLPGWVSRECCVHNSDDWILEAVQGGRYHVVIRYAVEPSDPVNSLGDLMIALAGIR